MGHNLPEFVFFEDAPILRTHQELICGAVTCKITLPLCSCWGGDGDGGGGMLLVDCLVALACPSIEVGFSCGCNSLDLVVCGVLCGLVRVMW